jgi:hypothetical protein
MKIEYFDCFVGGYFHSDYVSYHQFKEDFPEISKVLFYKHIEGNTITLSKNILLLPSYLGDSERANRLAKYYFKIKRKKLTFKDAKQICEILKKYL